MPIGKILLKAEDDPRKERYIPVHIGGHMGEDGGRWHAFLSLVMPGDGKALTMYGTYILNLKLSISIYLVSHSLDLFVWVQYINLSALLDWWCFLYGFSSEGRK